MTIIPTSITRSIGRKILTTKMNSPHIFFAGGIVGVVGSTVLACRATLKLEKTVDGVEKDLLIVKEGFEQNILTEKEYHKHLIHIYAKSAVKVGKLYGPSIIVGGVSIAALTGSHIQLTRRNTALTFTLAAVSKAYNEYRIRVQEEIGEKRELDIYRGLGDDTVEIEGHKKKVQVTDPNAWSIYARVFDEYNTNWVKDPEYNRTFLQCQQNYYNQKLKVRGHVFLNEIYDALGMERSRAGAVVGWITDGNGDGYIDFGLFEASSSRFMNNYERSIILDFNVDGVVYDKIKE